jgi:DNA-binding XRE family transcriptional regulator
VLERFAETVAQSTLDGREQFYMDLRSAAGIRLLNLRGGGSTGKLSEETKERIRIANTGFRSTAETRKKLSEWQRGRKCPHIVESNKRRSAAGQLFANYVRPKGADHPRFGVKHSLESIAKMRLSQRGHRRATPESRAVVSQKVRGERNAAAVLTETQVREIRAKYQPYKYQQSTLAEEYGVSRHTISGIVDGRLWRHLLEPVIQCT